MEEEKKRKRTRRGVKDASTRRQEKRITRRDERGTTPIERNKRGREKQKRSVIVERDTNIQPWKTTRRNEERRKKNMRKGKREEEREERKQDYTHNR